MSAWTRSRRSPLWNRRSCRGAIRVADANTRARSRASTCRVAPCVVSRSPYRAAVRTTARASTPAAGKIQENVDVVDSPVWADRTMSQPARPIRAADAAAARIASASPAASPRGSPARRPGRPASRTAAHSSATDAERPAAGAVYSATNPSAVQVDHAAGDPEHRV